MPDDCPGFLVPGPACARPPASARSLRLCPPPTTLISEPRFSTPCEMRFFPREKRKMAFSKKNPLKRPFSFSCVGKIAQSPYRAPEPRNPKSAFKSPKNAILDPPGKWPEKSIKMSKTPVFGHFNSPKMGFLDILIDFSGRFPGGSKMAFFGLLMHFWGFGVPGLCRGTGRLQFLRGKNRIS